MYVLLITEHIVYLNSSWNAHASVRAMNRRRSPLPVGPSPTFSIASYFVFFASFDNKNTEMEPPAQLSIASKGP